jgi:type I site-specific restriction endonuclease
MKGNHNHNHNNSKDRAEQTKQIKDNKIKQIKKSLVDMDTVDSAFFLSALTQLETGKVTKDEAIQHFTHIIEVLQKHDLEVKQLKDALEKTKNMFVSASKFPQIKIEEVAAGDPRPPGGKYGFGKTVID